MKLLNFEGYNVTVAPEAMSIKCFREIWNRDRTQSKDKAITEFGFIYFYLDPRSTYMYLTDEEERMELIKEHQGFPKNWKPDEKLVKAMETYQKLVKTAASLMVEDLKLLADKIRLYLRNLDIAAAMEQEDSKLTLTNLVKALNDLPSSIEKISAAEKKANEEIEEISKLRANKVASLGDGGLSKLYKSKGQN